MRCQTLKTLERKKRTKKRHLTLLEVLIAFAIIVMCVIPLLYPHVFMLRAQSEMTQKIELDHAVNLLYGEILVSLQMNDIPWNDIAEGRQFLVDAPFLHAAGYSRPLPYAGRYAFNLEKSKTSPQDSRSVFLLNLIFSFTPKGIKDEDAKSKAVNYRYKIVLVRDLGAAVPEEEDKKHEDP